MMANPVIAEVTRGQIVESTHRGAWVVCDASGVITLTSGSISTQVYPRSAIKAFQCLPLIVSGAADRFKLSDEEIALCCSSHNGEPEHVRVARSILRKCGADETSFECGAHAPTDKRANEDLIRQGDKPLAVHNNCSGKHAGMIALATHLGVSPLNYTHLNHSVQQRIVDTIAEHCEVDMAAAPVGIDGCSVPNWALPLKNIAMGFAKLTSHHHAAGHRMISAVRAHPFMVAGTGRFDTEIMQEIPRLFIKVGAEGVYCGCVPHAQLGFALKIDDGASRGSEVAIAAALSRLDCWTDAERAALKMRSVQPLTNWRKIHVGDIRGAN
jgi:L-asparaginase II